MTEGERPAADRGMGWTLVAVLAAGLALRVLIAWVWLPESGFFLDVDLMADWVRILSTQGWGSFYRPDATYFIDYPPVYFMILTGIGWLNSTWMSLTGGPDITVGLLKMPPILADVGGAALLAPLAARVVGRAAAVPAAAIYLFNPAVVVDSALYGQNDSVGALVVVAALVCLVRGWTEGASALAVLATLVKFQFGFMVPVVLIVGLRRHLAPGGDRLRVLTSAAAAVVTLAIVCAPFGLALYDAAEPYRSLWHRFAAASEAFPGVTQNAFNLWMNPLLDVLHHEAGGITAGRLVDDSAVLLAIGPLDVTWQLIGGVLFAVAAAMALWLLLRRDDPVAIVMASFALAVALYLFPTRIHERYLVPALAVGAPLGVSRLRGWRTAYALLSAIAFLAVYFVYTLPNLNRHLERDRFLNDTVLSPWGIYLLSAVAVGTAGWVLWTVAREARQARPLDAPPAAGEPAPPGISVAEGPMALLDRLGPKRMTLVLLVAVSLAAAAVSARFGFGAGGWLWNLDLAKVHYPLAVFFHEALLAGQLPLWNDRLGMGFPLYAEGQIGAFYPPNWLIFRLEPLLAMDVSRLLHLTLAGVGAGLLGLRVAGSRQGAMVAALVAVLGGAIVTKLEWWNLVAAYGWIPWVLLPLARRGGAGRRDVVIAGIAWGIQALAGHPNTWLLTGLAALVLLARRPLLPTFGRIAAFGALGAAVGAVQLVPTLLLQRISVRSLGLSADDLFTSAATPFDLLGLGFAQAFVRTQPDGAWDFATTWYPDGIFALLEANAYVGLPVIGLAALGLTTRRARRWVLLAAVMTAVAVVAAFRPEWWQALPVLNGLRSPTRAYLVVSLALAVLAAIGISRLGRDRGGGRAGLIAMGAVAVAYLLVTVAARSVPPIFDLLLSWSTTSVTPDNAAEVRGRAVPALTSLWPAALELAAAVAMGWMLLRRRSALLVSAAVVLAALPLVTLSPVANPLRAVTSFSFASTPFVARVVAQEPERVLVTNPLGYWEGMPDQLAAAGVADVDMFSSLNLLAGDRLTSELRADPGGPLARVVGIDLLATLDGTCPGRPVADVPEARATLCRVDDRLVAPFWIPSSAVRTYDGPAGVPEAALDLEAVVASAQPMDVTVDGPHATQVAIDAPGDGWVYLDRAWWYGWRMTIDGSDVAVRSAAGGQLVAVPAGRHVLTSSFVPWDAAVGLAAGVTALVAVGATRLAGRLRRTNRSWSPTSPTR